MELVVDLEKVTVVLADPDDLSGLSLRVAVPADASAASHDTVHRLHDVLQAAYVGRLDDHHRARIRPDALVFHAAGQVDEGWDLRFAGFCTTMADGLAADGTLPAAIRWPADGADHDHPHHHPHPH